MFCWLFNQSFKLVLLPTAPNLQEVYTLKVHHGGGDENGEERKRNRKGRRNEFNKEVDIRCPKFTAKRGTSIYSGQIKIGHSLGLNNKRTVLDDLKIDVTK